VSLSAVCVNWSPAIRDYGIDSAGGQSAHDIGFDELRCQQNGVPPFLIIEKSQFTAPGVNETLRAVAP